MVGAVAIALRRLAAASPWQLPVLGLALSSGPLLSRRPDLFVDRHPPVHRRPVLPSALELSRSYARGGRESVPSKDETEEEDDDDLIDEDGDYVGSEEDWSDFDGDEKQDFSRESEDESD